MLMLEEEMADDEVFALIVSFVLGTCGAVLWYVRGLRMASFGRPTRVVGSLLLVPLGTLALHWIVLKSFAAVEVRTDARYQVLFVAMGAIWAFLLPQLLSVVGISYRDDALERRNGAAAVALSGTIIGLGIVFTASNMGEGPSIWNTVATALAATAALFAVVFALAHYASVAESIAVERDLSSGVRFAGLILGCAVVLGRASAGDWVSVPAMFGDLVALGWPVALLTAVAIVLEQALRPSFSNPRPALLRAGVLPALAYLMCALSYVAILPDWRGSE